MLRATRAVASESVPRRRLAVAVATHDWNLLAGDHPLFARPRTEVDEPAALAAERA